MKRFFVCVRRFGTDNEFSTCVLASHSADAQKKGLEKLCKKCGFDGFYFDNDSLRIGDFYTQCKGYISFYSGSSARYVEVLPYTKNNSVYCHSCTHFLPLNPPFLGGFARVRRCYSLSAALY